MNPSGSNPHPVRAVSFDAGGTLIEPFPSVGHVYAQVAVEQGWTGLAPERLSRQFREAWKNKEPFRYTRACWRAVVERTFQRAPVPFFDALYDRFTQPELWHVYPDVFQTLACLRRRGLRLALVSNWDERLHPLLDALGLIQFFDLLMISHATGFHKPAPEMFLETAARLRIPPAELLHVGDSRVEDFEGARNAGAQALLLDRGGESGEGERIGSLRELREVIRNPR